MLLPFSCGLFFPTFGLFIFTLWLCHWFSCLSQSWSYCCCSCYCSWGSLQDYFSFFEWMNIWKLAVFPVSNISITFDLKMICRIYRTIQHFLLGCQKFHSMDHILPVSQIHRRCSIHDPVLLVWLELINLGKFP